MDRTTFIAGLKQATHDSAVRAVRGMLTESRKKASSKFYDARSWYTGLSDQEKAHLHYIIELTSNMAPNPKEKVVVDVNLVLTYDGGSATLTVTPLGGSHDGRFLKILTEGVGGSTIKFAKVVVSETGSSGSRESTPSKTH